MNYGFIGLGNMASAIITGMIDNGGVSGAQIYGYDINSATGNRLRQSANIHVVTDLEAMIPSVQVLVLAVKPQVLPRLLPQISAMLPQDLLVISIAAGKNIAFLEQHLGDEMPIVRVMPNINARVLTATCCYSVNSRVLPIHKQIVEEMFCSIGVISELAENLFSVFTAICGSAPAFTYLYIDALAKAAVAAGMPRAQALALAAHGVYGSAKMVMESELHPGELVDQVCSPGGTTIEGVLALERAGFASGIHQAVAAVIAKDKKLAEK